jgi:hypothetical protein
MGSVKVDEGGKRARVGAGQDKPQDAGMGHGGDSWRGVLRGKKLAHLGADTFTGNRL